MIRIAQQVSRAIRILRGNRDESARASHLVVNKGQLAYNELLQVNQAEREKFFQSTFFERKTMKTAFKRVALVAAAALAIGGISAVSANATIYSESLAISAATSSISAGTTASTVITDTFLPDAGVGQATTATAYLLSSPAGNSVLPTVSTTPAQVTANTAANSTVTGAAQVATNTAAAGSLTTVGTYTVSLVNPSVAGTYVVKIIPANANANSVTWTVTVSALAPITAASSTLTPTPSTLSAAKAASTAAGSIAFVAQNATANAPAATVSATVSGPGLVSFTNSYAASGRAISQAVASNTGTIYVFADGTAGVGTITISSGTTVLGTETVTFFGTPAKIVVTDLKPTVVVSGTPTDVYTVSEFDANGAAVPVTGFGTLAVSSDATGSVTNTLSAPDTATAAYGCSTTVVCYGVTAGATAGTANLTISDSTNTLTAAPIAVRASSGVPTTVTFTTDAASYPAGGVGTLTITLADAAGPVPAGTYTVLTGQATSSLALVTGTLPGVAGPGNIVVGDAGTDVITFNAPLSDGSVTVGGTAASTSVTVTPATFTVSSGASDAANAATDAANEATDAANAATDAANAAADSADAATQAAQDAGDKADAALAAVTALSQQVTTLLAKVAALAATIAKIAKKVKA